MRKKIIVGCEESQAVTIALRKMGHEAYSCDLLPCSGGHPEWHIQGDVRRYIKQGPVGQVWFQDSYRKYITFWDMAIFFPDCTYLTCSAEWAYKEPPYHQKLKPGTLFGEKRSEARREAVEFVKELYNCPIPKVSIENPVGRLSTLFMKPHQTIQPYNFGDDASKKTCLWLKNLPILENTIYVPPRLVDGVARWANQTDSGQNKLTPSKDRAKIRSKTYPGIAAAMAAQWA